MIEEINHCTNIMKKGFNKERVITKEGDEDFESSTECWSCHNVYTWGIVPREKILLRGKGNIVRKILLHKNMLICSCSCPFCHLFLPIS